MNNEEALKIINEKIVVTKQYVTIAKANILESIKIVMDSNILINQVLKKLDKQMPEKIILNPAIDPIPYLNQAADSISWRAAISEAIWQLIHENYLIPTTSDLCNNSLSLEWTTGYQNSGGTSSGWSFNEFFIRVPTRLRRPLSHNSNSPEFLVSPDLYLHNLSIPNIHPEVAASLQEAVKCFRQELFTSSITMLGRASEGAWIELGSALFSILPPNELKQVTKPKNDFDNPAFGVGKKIEIVVSLFSRQDLFLIIAEESGVTLSDLRQSANWSTTLQDARNIIHFGNTPAIPTTYEKVAVFLLGAVPHLRVLYNIISSANKIYANNNNSN
jgi:hypothetical protein